MSTNVPQENSNMGQMIPGQHSTQVSASGNDPQGEGGAVNPIELVLDRLQGRWVYAISTALVVAIVAAAIAWLFAPIKFSSAGWLQGNSQNETIVQQIAETGEVRGFEQFLEGQVILIKSSDVVDRAINDPAMKRLLDERGRMKLAGQIAANLVADVYGGTELIQVTYSDSDPGASAVITNAVMNSYITLHGSEDADRRNRTKMALRGYKTENLRKTNDLRIQQQDLLSKSRYGIADIGSFASENANEMVALELEKKRVKEMIAKLSEKAREQEIEITGDEILPPTETELEAFEPNLKALKTEIDQVRVQSDQLRSRLSDEHRHVRILDSTIKSMQSNLERRKLESTERWMKGPGKEKSYAKLEEKLQKLGIQIKEKRSQIDEMNSLRDNYESLQRNIDDLEEEYTVLDDRLTGIEFEEDALKDRISIAQLAEAPTIPASDKRAQIAVAVFAASIFGVFALFFLLGTVDQRAFAVRQLQSDKGQFQCLGVVPDTGPSSDDPEALEIAMGCVHRLRNKLESMRQTSSERGFVMLISSPFQGDGKTTMATLLGWSYAEAGYRTCLVDCDFIGRSLSHQFGKLQDVGLKEALKRGDIDGEVIPLGNENLSILPIGLDNSINAEHVPIEAIRKLLDQLREQYDMIIMDTGPLSGSIESTPIAGSVDGVLLTLRKGRSRLPLRRCVEELRDLGAPYLGVVLNYADRSDYRHFSSTSKSIKDLLKEEATGERKRNPLTDLVAYRRDGDQS